MGTAGSATLFFLLLSAPAPEAAIRMPQNTLPPGFMEYRVRPNDTLGHIAPRDHWELIMKVNRLDARHLPAGKKILVPDDLEAAQGFSPVPDKLPNGHGRAVRVFLGSQYFGAYEDEQLVFWGPISSGRDGFDTPAGNFSVGWKAKDYYSKKYEAEMPYAVNFSAAGYFLHAQSLPGRRASHGCIRLLESDAVRLFYWIKKGDRIEVLTSGLVPPSG